MEGPVGRGRSHIEGPSGAPAPSSGGELHQEGQDGLHVLTHRGRYLREIEEAQGRLTTLARLAGRPGLDPLRRSLNRTITTPPEETPFRFARAAHASTE